MLVSIRNLSASLPPGADRPLAIDDVSLDIAANEIVCIVGESGSGKSMTAHAVMGLLPRGVAVKSRMKSGFRFLNISTESGLSALWLSSTMTTGRSRRITLISADGS